MNVYIDIQNASQSELPLMEPEIIDIAQLALREYKTDAELTIRFVTPQEITELNHTYRQQNKPTNVLAFPYTLPPVVELEYAVLGDVVICPEVLARESKELNKTIKAHWSLIIIHGILHLLGYDHIEDSDATIMQALEIKLLAELGYTNPYELEDI